MSWPRSMHHQFCQAACRLPAHRNHAGAQLFLHCMHLPHPRAAEQCASSLLPLTKHCRTLPLCTPCPAASDAHLGAQAPGGSQARGPVQGGGGRCARGRGGSRAAGGQEQGENVCARTRAAWRIMIIMGRACSHDVMPYFHCSTVSTIGAARGGFLAAVVTWCCVGWSAGTWRAAGMFTSLWPWC